MKLLSNGAISVVSRGNAGNSTGNKTFLSTVNSLGTSVTGSTMTGFE
jgi:hypothetical protein